MSMNSLKELFFTRNLIENANLSVLIMLRLESFHLGNNKLSDVSFYPPHAPILQYLYLEHNNFNYIPAMYLSILPKLKWVIEMNNNLQRFPDCNAISHLLELIDLSHNQITHIDKKFLEKAISLTHLYLTSNQLTYCPKVERLPSYRLLNIYVKNNPFHCDRKMCWIHEHLININVQGATCTTPQLYKEMAPTDVDEYGLGCYGMFCII